MIRRFPSRLVVVGCVLALLVGIAIGPAVSPTVMPTAGAAPSALSVDLAARKTTGQQLDAVPVGLPFLMFAQVSNHSTETVTATVALTIPAPIHTTGSASIQGGSCQMLLCLVALAPGRSSVLLAPVIADGGAGTTVTIAVIGTPFGGVPITARLSLTLEQGLPVPTAVPTVVPTVMPTEIATLLPTEVPTVIPTEIATLVPTVMVPTVLIPTVVVPTVVKPRPTETQANTPTATATTTPSSTLTPTVIITPTATATMTPTTTASPTATITSTATPSATPTRASTAPSIPTVLPTATKIVAPPAATVMVPTTVPPTVTSPTARPTVAVPPGVTNVPPITTVPVTTTVVTPSTSPVPTRLPGTPTVLAVGPAPLPTLLPSAPLPSAVTVVKETITPLEAVVITTTQLYAAAPPRDGDLLSTIAVSTTVRVLGPVEGGWVKAQPITSVAPGWMWGPHLRPVKPLPSGATPASGTASPPAPTSSGEVGAAGGSSQPPTSTPVSDAPVVIEQMEAEPTTEVTAAPPEAKQVVLKVCVTARQSVAQCRASLADLAVEVRSPLSGLVLASGRTDAQGALSVTVTIPAGSVVEVVIPSVGLRLPIRPQSQPIPVRIPATSDGGV